MKILRNLFLVLALVGIGYSSNVFGAPAAATFDEATYLRACKGNKNLKKAKLKGATFIAKNLAGADFTEADLSGAKFIKSNLKGAKFIKTKLDGTNFSDCELDDVQFIESK